MDITGVVLDVLGFEIYVVLGGWMWYGWGGFGLRLGKDVVGGCLLP